MRFARTVSLLRLGAAVLRAPRAQAFGCGLLAGLYLLDWTHQFAASFGTSLSVAVSSALAIAFGCELGWNKRRGEVETRANAFRQLAIAMLIPAVHTILFPIGILGSRGLTGCIPVETIAIPIIGLLVLWSLAAVLLAFPVFWLVRLPSLLFESITARFSTEESLNRPRADLGALTLYSLSGSSAGLLLGVFVTAPWFGAHSTGVIAALCGGGGGIVLLLRSRHALPDSEVAHHHDHQSLGAPVHSLPSASAAQSHVFHDDRSDRKGRGLGPTLRALAIIAFLGAGTALAARVSHQLMPVSGFILYSEWAAILGGTVVGAALARRMQRREANGQPVSFESRAAWLSLLAAAWGCLSLGIFGKLVELSLAATSSISFVPLLMFVRGSIAVAFVLPYALAWGAAATFWRQSRNTTKVSISSKSAATTSPTGLPFGLPWQFVAWTAGLVAIHWAFANGVLAGDLVMMVALVLFLLSGACFWSSRSIPRGWVSRGLAAAACCVIVSAGWLRSHYDPARSARLLFSTNVFAAYQGGVDGSSLTALDDGRSLAVREGARGAYTAWKYRGSQVHFRENGIPKGTVSTEPGLCPQYAAELLPAVLALTLHEDPQQVLLLGLGSSASLSTCLAFPLVNITCIEGDAALLNLTERFVWTSSEYDPREDHRVKLVQVDPALASVCREDKYDVILSTAEPLALWQAEPLSTREFYRSAARRLFADGLFVQRFQHYDYGPRPFRTVVHTMRQAFAEVMAIEAAPGEMILLATNSAKGIVRKETLKRFQAPQVRSTLSQAGWDWTVPLNLGAWQSGPLDEIARTAPMNTAANGCFAFTIPQEVMRWGPKSREIAAALAPHASRLLECNNIPKDDPEVLRRLGEVVGQHKLMTEYPDQWWAYRKTIRDQFKDGPRSIIQQVTRNGFERELHPDDKQRLKYFTALGAASRQRNPSAREIARVAQFAVPYDPLVSYFLHHEVAALYARTKAGLKDAELAHRLHAINFSDPRDRSVRDIVDALTLLVKHPEACATPAERWDHLNNLLQVLKGRWETRGAVEPKASRIVLNDLEKSISSIEEAFETMDELHADAGVSEADWQTRRDYLERSIVRPLRTYRSNLLPYHLQKERRNRSQTADSADAPGAEFDLPGM